MYQPLRIALRGDEVIPAARGDMLPVQLQNPIRQRIALVMIEKQPAIQLLLAQRCLNFLDLHRLFKPDLNGRRGSPRASPPRFSDAARAYSGSARPPHPWYPPRENPARRPTNPGSGHSNTVPPPSRCILGG